MCDDVLRLKEFRRAAHDQKHSLVDPVGSGGALGMDGMHGGVLSVVSMHGGAESRVVVDAAIGITDLLPSFAVLEAFHSLVTSSSFPDLPDTISLPLIDSELLAFHASAPISFLPSRSFDLSKCPSSYSEAMACPD